MFDSQAAEDVEYPAYGVTAAAAGAGGQLGRTGSGSAGSPTSGGSLSGDRKLAQNAQMYHYQHQKQQMIAFDRSVLDDSYFKMDHFGGQKRVDFFQYSPLGTFDALGIS